MTLRARVYVLVGAVAWFVLGMRLSRAGADGARDTRGAKPAPHTLMTHAACPDPAAKRQVIFEDDRQLWIALGFGDAARPQQPGLFVQDKKSSAWIQIDKVTTKGAVWGRSPTLAEMDGSPQLKGLSVGWSYAHYGQDAFVALPLRGGSHIAFPDRVVPDGRAGTWTLHFDSSLEFAPARTRLKFARAELARALAGGCRSTSAPSAR